MKPVTTFRANETVKALLDAELKARPGVTLSFVINEKITAGFRRSAKKNAFPQRPHRKASAAV